MSCEEKSYEERPAAPRAFTLIELLVVVTIIVLLLSMLLPAMSKAIEAGQVAVCRSNLKQLGMGMLLYSSDNERTTPCWGWEFFEPYGPNTTSVSPTGAMPDDFVKTGLIWQYADNVNLYRCAAYPTKKVGSAGNPVWGYDELKDNYWTYSVNGQIGYSLNNPSMTINPLWVVRLSKLPRSPASMFMLFEQNDNDFHAFDNSVTLFDYPQGSIYDSLGYYHLDGGNLVMFDGHVELMSRTQYYSQISTKEGTLKLIGGYLGYWWY